MHGRIERVNLSRLVDGPWVRKVGSTADLEASFTRGVGQVLQNIVVRARPDGRLEVLAGKRRVTAARKIGWSHVDARVVEADDREAELIFLEENLRRKQLSGAEQRAAVQRLAQLLGGEGRGGDRRSANWKSKRHDVAPSRKLATLTGKSMRQMQRLLAPQGTARDPTEVMASRLRQSLRIAQRCLDELGKLPPRLKAEVRAAISSLSKSVR